MMLCALLHLWQMEIPYGLLGLAIQKVFFCGMCTEPESGNWKPLVDSFPYPALDPCLSLEVNVCIYLCHGSSNVYLIYGLELAVKLFVPKTSPEPLIQLCDIRHKCERLSQHNDNTFLQPFAEGAWMSQYKGKYYLQHAAPGTEFSGNGDGVYQSNHP